MTHETEKRARLNWPLGLGVVLLGWAVLGALNGATLGPLMVVTVIGAALLVVGLIRR
jgi:hypothetical protein